MKFATDELSVVGSLILDVNPNHAVGSLEVYFIESQMTEGDRLALKPYVDRKILRGMGKTIGMERTDLLDRYLAFDRKMAGVGFLVGFDAWLTADFCKKREITVITESRAVNRLCNIWNVPVISPAEFSSEVSHYRYEKMKVRR
jgi:hypothetical protein